VDYLFHLIVIISLYVALTATLDLLIGHTGILSFAHAAIYGVGAYATAILTVYANWHWLPALAAAFLIGTAVAAIVGIPTLRLGGDYFILALFGFQLIVTTVILNWEDLTNGPFGIRGIPRPSFGTGPISSGWPIASFTLVAVAIIVFLVWRLVSGPLKLVLHSIRDDETVAQSLGIDVVQTRIVIFALAGGLAAVVGSLLAFYARFIDVSSFTVETMILLWAMVYVGGVRTIAGAIVGPAILVLFPEVFRFIDFIGVDRSQLQEALYGLLMVLLMLYRPQGVMGGRRNIVTGPV
jgi:branched-chain amino acid transport system permease protein